MQPPTTLLYQGEGAGKRLDLFELGDDLGGAGHGVGYWGAFDGEFPDLPEGVFIGVGGDVDLGR